MNSRTEDSWVEYEVSDLRENSARVFQLYEEYSKAKIAELATTRMERFSKANSGERRQLSFAVDEEAEAFRTWLEDVKGFEPDLARYSAASIKSLLLGLPFGVQLAQVFDLAINPT